MKLRKYLSVLSAVVLLVTMSAIAAPVATVNAATTYTQGFEGTDGPTYTYGDAVTSNAMGHDSSNSLKITIDNAATSKTTDRAVLEDANGNPLAYTVGSKYEISMWYYTEDSFVGKVRILRETDLTNMASTKPSHVGYDLTNSDSNNLTTLTTGTWTKVTKTVDALPGTAGETGYWSVGVAANSAPSSPVTVYIDDVTITETVAEAEEEIETFTSVLNGKTGLFSGDSIAAGWRDTAFGKTDSRNGGGWSARLEKQWLMTTKKAAVAGQSLTVIEDRGHIIDQLHNNKNNTYDYVILEGGFNDCMGENTKGNSNMDAIPKLGDIAPTFDVADFDTSTFSGSFEELLYYATTYFPEAAIGFIVTYQTPDSQYGGITGNTVTSNEGYKQEDYFNRQMEICEKWNVPYLNLWSGTTADGKTYSGDIIDVDGNTVHFPGGTGASGDCIHLDTAGYDVITPYIATWMEGLTPYTVPGGNEMNAITSVYQYVGGGVDNSTLQAEEGYAVYTHTDGSLRTAFRVAATYRTDSADFDTIVLEDGSYKIKERGIILGTAGQILTTANTLKTSITGGFKDKYWAYDSETGTVTYTALVKNVSKAMIDTAYIARSYMVIERNGAEETIYSDMSISFTPQSLYDKAAAQLVAEGKQAPKWFSNDKTDDGAVDLG